jgi:hypothetical protein
MNKKVYVRCGDYPSQRARPEPVYGFGRSEEIAGETIVRRGCRDRFTIAAKVGLEWQEENR